MKKFMGLADEYYSSSDVYVCLFWILFLNDILWMESAFYVGKTDHSINEMQRLNGRMTPREAVIRCELDDECAGFTYHGPKTMRDHHSFQITFY